MCFYLPLQTFSLEYRSEIKLWDKKKHIINQKTCHLHHKFSSNFTHMPYNAPNTKNVYKGGKLPPLLVVTSEKIVMKDELEVYIKIQKNLPNYSIMESAAPFTRDFHPLDNARAEHTKRKSPVNLAIYRTLCGERGIRTPGTSQYAGFQDRCIRPLCHLSLLEELA